LSHLEAELQKLTVDARGTPERVVGCACRKLDPDVMVVQSAEDRQRENAPDRLEVSG